MEGLGTVRLSRLGCAACTLTREGPVGYKGERRREEKRCRLGTEGRVGECGTGFRIVLPETSTARWRPVKDLRFPGGG
jgi:hypothetical protein